MNATENELKLAVEHLHGGSAHLVQSVPACETFAGQTVWDSVVHVFDLVLLSHKAR
jgi:hypothetical protein